MFSIESLRDGVGGLPNSISLDQFSCHRRKHVPKLLACSARLKSISIPSPRVCPFDQARESDTVSQAGVNCEKFIWESPAIPETLGFNLWKREET